MNIIRTLLVDVCFFAAALVVLMLAFVALWHWLVERYRHLNAARALVDAEKARWKAWQQEVNTARDNNALNRTDGEPL